MALELPNGVGLPAVLEVNDEMAEVATTQVEELLQEREDNTLCRSARAKVGDGRCLFDISRTRYLYGKFH